MQDEGVILFITITTVLQLRSVLYSNTNHREYEYGTSERVAPFCLDQPRVATQQLNCSLNCINASTRSSLPLPLPFCPYQTLSLSHKSILYFPKSSKLPPPNSSRPLTLTRSLFIPSATQSLQRMEDLFSSLRALRG